MAVFYAIFDRKQVSGAPVEREYSATCKLAPQAPKSGERPANSGGLETARLIKIEAATAIEASSAISAMFPGNTNTKAVIVAEGNFKEPVTLNNS